MRKTLYWIGTFSALWSLWIIFYITGEVLPWDKALGARWWMIPWVLSCLVFWGLSLVVSGWCFAKTGAKKDDSEKNCTTCTAKKGKPGYLCENLCCKNWSGITQPAA